MVDPRRSSEMFGSRAALCQMTFDGKKASTWRGEISFVFYGILCFIMFLISSLPRPRGPRFILPWYVLQQGLIACRYLDELESGPHDGGVRAL